MKHTKIWSCLLALVLLVSCAVGIFAVSADAESTVIYYTLGEVEMEGSEHFATLAEALAALQAKNKKWGANESVEIRFQGEISGGTQDGLLFGLTTIWREDNTKLPIAFRGVDKLTSRDAYIYLDAAGGWYACANDYSFYNLTLPVGDQLTEFYAGSGNIYFEDVHFKEQNITIPTSAEQKVEYQLKHDVSRTVAERNDADLIPAGDAWMYLIENNPDVGNNLSRSLKKDRPQGDYKHDGDIGGGMYLNACVWYEVLTKKSCVGHTWRPDESKVGYTLPEELIPVLQEAAHKAVLDHYRADYYDDTYNPDLNGDNELNILNIGSSNGYYYPDELCQMLTTDGLTARVCTAYHSGVKLSEQWTWAAGTAAGDYQFRIFEADTNTAEEISNPDAKGVNFDYFQTKYAWDSITFYQTSGPFDDYGLDATKYDYLYEKALATCAKADNLYAFMRQYNPNARYTYYQVCPVPVGYPGVDSSLDSKSGHFYADNCTQEVFAGWPELKAGEKVQTSLTFGPGAEYYGTASKDYVSVVGYMSDYKGDPLTDETAAEIKYPEAASSYGEIPDIRPVDVEASIILDGGKVYRILARDGYAPTDIKIRMHSGTLYRIDGDNNTSDVVESFYGDVDILVDGGTVTNSVYGTYKSSIKGDLIIEIGGDAVVDSCIRGQFGSGTIDGDVLMTVSGNAKINGNNSDKHAYYGGGNATGRIVNTVSGGTLTGTYFGIRSGGAGRIVENNFTGGTLTGAFYGGHYESVALGQIVNRFEGGQIIGEVYAGCYSSSDSSKVTGLKTTVDGEEVTAAIVNYLSGTTFGKKTTSGSTTTYSCDFRGSSRGGTCGDVYNIVTGGKFISRFYGSVNGKTVGNVVTRISGNPEFGWAFYGFGADSSDANSTGKTVTLEIEGGTFKSSAYLGGYNLRDRVSNITVSGGSFGSDFYCGSYGGTAKEINATIQGGSFASYFYGGMYTSTSDIFPHKINVTVEGGTFSGTFWGGSRGVRAGDIHVIVRGNPEFKKNFAPGCWSKVPDDNKDFPSEDVVTGNIKLEIYGGTFPAKAGSDNAGVYVGSQTGTTGNIETIIGGGTFNGYFYGGYGGKKGTITNKITGGTFNNTVYFGSWGGSDGNISNDVSGGTFASGVYLAGKVSSGTVTNVIGNDKSGPTFNGTLYCGSLGKSTGDIFNTFNNGSFKNVYCGSASGASNGAVTNVFNGGTYINSITTCGYTTTNGKVLTTVYGGTFKEYLLAGGRGSINLPEGSEDYYCVETVVYGGTFKGVWAGGEGTSTIREGNTKLTIYGGTFDPWGTSASRRNSVCAAGRGMRHKGAMDVFIYGGTFNAEVVAGSYPNSNEDTYAKPNPDCIATVNIYGGTFNGPLMANSKWERGVCKQGTIILNPTESDIILNSTMVMRTDTDGAQAYEIVGGDHKIILGADAEIEATSVSGDVKFGQGSTWAKRVYATLPEGNTAKVSVVGPHCLDKIGESVVAVKGGVQLAGATMILTDRVAVRALFDKASVDQIDDFAFTFKMGEETLASGSKADLEAFGEDYYGIVLAKIGAKDFTSAVTFTGSDMVWDYEFSVELLADMAEEIWTDEAQALAKAMHNFATIVADPTAELPNKDLAPDLSKIGDFKASGEVGSETNFRVTGKGLVMGNAVGVRIYGTATTAIADTLTITVNGTDVTQKAVIAAGEGENAYTIDLYVNAKNMSDELHIVITEGSKTCLDLYDRVDAIAASYAEGHEKYGMARQLLVYIQAAVAYATKA